MPNPENPIVPRFQSLFSAIRQRAGKLIYKFKYGETYPISNQSLLDDVRAAMIGNRRTIRYGDYSVLAYEEDGYDLKFGHIFLYHPVEIEGSTPAVAQTDLRLNRAGIQLKTSISQQGVLVATREDNIIHDSGKLSYLGDTPRAPGVYLSRQQAMDVTNRALAITRQIKEVGIVYSTFEQPTLNPADFIRIN